MEPQPKKGPKAPATPAGVNRRDMAEPGPGMAQAGSASAPVVEGDEATRAYGEPAEVNTPEGRPVTEPGDDGVP